MPRLSLGALAVVFGGGVAGGMARYGVVETLATPAGRFPWGTLGVNTAGAFALPLLLAALTTWGAHRYLKPLLATGFLGAFTTFSSVVVTTDVLAAHGHPGTGAAYLAGSTAAALLAAAAGLRLGQAVSAAAASRYGRP